jgi:hypothetical protein
MNTTSERGTEVATYLAQVRAALADLPPSARDQLIDDVPEHLAEVAAAGAGPLETQLGPPAVFAAELRAAAGLAPRAETARSEADVIGDALRAASRSGGRMLGYPGGLADAARAFGPAWWAVRGALIVYVATLLSRTVYGYSEFFYGSLPLRTLFWLAAILGAVISLRVGQAVARASAGARLLSALVSLAVVVAVVPVSPLRALLPY